MLEFDTYREWRRALHEAQQEFDSFEEDYDHIGSPSYGEYMAARKLHEDRIAALYAVEADHVNKK